MDPQQEQLVCEGGCGCTVHRYCAGVILASTTSSELNLVLALRLPILHLKAVQISGTPTETGHRLPELEKNQISRPI